MNLESRRKRSLPAYGIMIVRRKEIHYPWTLLGEKRYRRT